MHEIVKYKDKGYDDITAIETCIQDAIKSSQNKIAYIPPGTYKLDRQINVVGENIKITGAGIWYTNIQFTSNERKGGIVGGGESDLGICNNIEICHMYLNSNICRRNGMTGLYTGITDLWENGLIHDIWEDHFSFGFCMGSTGKRKNYSDWVKIINCRARNNYGDGIHLNQGTSNATVYNCSVRNNGDDGLALNTYDYKEAKDLENDVFCYNTIEFNWRSGAIGVYGGTGHKIYNNYIRDTHTSAGIHLCTAFDGYKFKNTKEINFMNNVLIKTGSKKGYWNQNLGAIDIFDDYS